MANDEKVRATVPARYTRPERTAAPPPPARDPAALISELLRPRAAPTRSREEQAFIDLQHGCHQ
jgi:hypothetical protein